MIAEESKEIKELLSDIPGCKVNEFKGEVDHEENNQLTEPNDSPFRVRRLSRSFSIPANCNDNDNNGNEEILLSANDENREEENHTSCTGGSERKSKFILLKRSRSLGNIFLPELPQKNANEPSDTIDKLTEKVEALEIEVLTSEKPAEDDKVKSAADVDNAENNCVNDEAPVYSKLIDRPQTSPPVLYPSIPSANSEPATTKLSILERMQKSLGFFFQCTRKDEDEDDFVKRKGVTLKYQMRSRTPDAKLQSHVEKKPVSIPVSKPPQTSEVPMRAVDFVTKVDEAPKCGEIVKKLPQFFDVSGPKGPLLEAPSFRNEGKKCLVLDLDETLVHSSFHVPEAHDLVVTLALPDGSQQNIYVAKRPGVDEFLARMSQEFEVVIFTASLAHYADPVIDFLTVGMNRHLKEPLEINLRLYRESCLFLRGLYVKDLSRLGRKLEHTVIVDNSPASFLLQPDHGIPIKSWFSDTSDRELSLLQDSLMHLVDAESVAGWRAKLASF